MAREPVGKIKKLQRELQALFGMRRLAVPIKDLRTQTNRRLCRADGLGCSAA